MKRYNPGTITDLIVGVDRHFKYVFIAYGAWVKGFTHMRKVVGVDCTWLKSKYKGVILITSAQDGNGNMYPLAWVVVDMVHDQFIKGHTRYE